MAQLRFGAYQYQHLPLDVFRQRCLDAERLGSDVLWNCDTVVEPDLAANWRAGPREDAVFEEVATAVIPKMRALS